MSTSITNETCSTPSLTDADFRNELRNLLEMDFQYFCILGMQKSGTSWIQLMLSAHPEIAITALGETEILNYFPDGLRNIQDACRQRSWSYQITNEDMQLMSRFYLQYVLHKFHGSEAKVIGEKNPNYRRILPYISTVIPHARIIHVIRDPRDVIVSRFFHEMRTRPDYMKDNYNLSPSKKPESLPDEYVVTSLQQYNDSISQIRNDKLLFPASQYCEVHYEDMHKDPSTQLSSLFRFLNVSNNDKITADCIEAGDFKRFSGGRKRGEEDTSSFFRKGIVGDWQNYLTPNQISAVKQSESSLLSDLGYTK